MKKVRTTLSNLLARLKRKVDRFGYPIVTMTAPKTGRAFKVNLLDPAFNRPISELRPQARTLIEILESKFN